jgi:hypothetical protein
VNGAIAYNTNDGLRCENDSASVHNIISYFNSGAQIVGNVTVNYCDVQGGWSSGVGNINYGPVFASDSCLVIQPGSPCIDAGDPDPAYNDVCFPPSLGGVRNDMGAHGGPGGCGWPSDGGCGLNAIGTPIPSLVSHYELSQNYPNPFNPSTSISFDLLRPGMTTLTVYNLLGQNVATQLNEPMSAGHHTATFDGHSLSSGVYIYTLQSGTFVESRKMVLMK